MLIWMSIRNLPAPCLEKEVADKVNKIVLEVFKTGAPGHFSASFPEGPPPTLVRGLYVEMGPWVSLRERLLHVYLVDQICIRILKRERLLHHYEGFTIEHLLKHPADKK